MEKISLIDNARKPRPLADIAASFTSVHGHWKPRGQNVKTLSLSAGQKAVPKLAAARLGQADTTGLSPALRARPRGQPIAAIGKREEQHRIYRPSAGIRRPRDEAP